jgi:serine O-acetyltransferase
MDLSSNLSPDKHSLAMLWASMKSEAVIIIQKEPLLVDFFTSHVLSHDTLASALSALLAVQFVCNNRVMSCDAWTGLCLSVLNGSYDDTGEPLLYKVMADLDGIMHRDPAATSRVNCFLYFKGFKALQSHRIAHVLWKKGRKELAYLIQSTCSEAYTVDIHPAAEIGCGLFLDHVSS